MNTFDPRFRIAYALSKKNNDFTALSAIAAIIMSVGFFLGVDATNDNYTLVYQYISAHWWSFIFGVYGLITILSRLYDIHPAVRMVSGVVGIWAWMYIFLSFTVFDASPVAPTEYLLSVPIIAEVWNLIGLPNCCFNKQKDDSDD